MATENIEFTDVFSIVRGGLHPGRLKMNKTGIVFKSGKTGVLDSIPLADIASSSWMRVARGFGIKVTAKNGAEYRYHGFKEGEYEKLKEHYSKHYELDLNALELSVKGWNWGAAKFKGSVMTFEVDNKPAFEIPLKDVSSATTGKNEVTMEFHRNDEAKVALMEMRFFVPSYQDESSEDPVKSFHEQVLAKADIIQATGDAIITFEEVVCLTPRGKYSIRVYPTFLQLHGKTYDYKVPHTTLLRLFLLPHQDNRFMFFVISLDPPLRQGQTRYPFLILQFERDEEMTCALNLTQTEIEEKYGNKLSQEMTGAVFEVVSRVFKEICQKKITVPGSFKSKAATSAITCSYKASNGLLYPLERGFIFVHKPALHVRTEEINSVNFARGSTTGRTFDFELDLKNNTTVIFSNIPREEYTPLFDFVNAKNLRIKNKGGKGGSSSLDHMIESDGEDHDAYLRQMKQEGAEREVDDDDDDSEEDDEDFDPDKEKIDDVKEEYESDFSNSTGSDSDSDYSAGEAGHQGESGSEDEEARERRREKRREEKEKKKAKAKAPKRKTDDGEGGSSRKRSKKDKDAPKRPMSAYFLFLNANRERIKEENPGISFTDITKKGSEMWKEVEDKTEWEDAAKQAKVKYDEEMKEYNAKLKERGEDPEASKSKSKPKSKSSKSSVKRTPQKSTENSKFKSKEYISDSDSTSSDDDGGSKKKSDKKDSGNEKSDDEDEKKEKSDKKKTESEEDEEDSDASHESGDVEKSTRSTRSKRAEGDEELKELDENNAAEEDDAEVTGGEEESEESSGEE